MFFNVAWLIWQPLSLCPPLPGAVLNDNSDITSSYMSYPALGLPV